MEQKIGQALVVGAGIGGIRSALSLAQVGYRVYLIDKAPNMGGTLRQLDHQFPTDHCGMCRMLPSIDRDISSQHCLRKGFFHERIELLPATEIAALEGEPGRFVATLRAHPTLVDSERCMGCGACSRVCPVEAPDEFNAGMTLRKAIYLPVPHNLPNHYVVDTDSCTGCGECERVCPTGAIDLHLEAKRAFRILIVDDELIVRDSIKEWLEVEGFGVDMAESGQEALEKLSGGEFNLMLLDVKMPGMDGVEVLKRSKEINPELAVVMMTAYATVETAVEAMKIGALDYLLKPFDPEALVSMVGKLYRSFVRTGERKLEVGAVILAAGFGSFDPPPGNTYGYGDLPDVVTSIEFERILSGTGPNRGRLVRPSDGKEVRRLAWLQCVGSRNRAEGADFCSSICCMFSIKEALLAREHSEGVVEAAIFYMDMRTFGKDFQRYRDRAEEEGVRFVRSRIHSIETGGDGSLHLRYVDVFGTIVEEAFDMVVLATGQRPSAGSEELMEVCAIEKNAFGFCRSEPFSITRSSREGIFSAGSFSGLRDISESIIQAGSAALQASALLHRKGGGLAQVPAREEISEREIARELPNVSIVLCTCQGALKEAIPTGHLIEDLKSRGAVGDVFTVNALCTREGLEALGGKLSESASNRVLIGACLPCVYEKRFKALGNSLGLDGSLVDVVDIRTPLFSDWGADLRGTLRATLAMGLERLKRMDPPVPHGFRPVVRSALVVGGGIAGMTAALAIADHGFPVDLLEREDALGGNLLRIEKTLQGGSPRELLEKTIALVEKHPNIRVHRKARLIASEGQVGDFRSTFVNEGGESETIAHGVTVLATGGSEAKTDAYGYGASGAILTQHELEERLHQGTIDPSSLQSVVMIQCVDSRQPPRNYCSRICCGSALKNALNLKEKNKEIELYVLYRDMMAYGFIETSYSTARQAGVIFIPYQTDARPEVTVDQGQVRVRAFDPILSREIVLSPDLLVLSTGIVPAESSDTAQIFGVSLGTDGFFAEAEFKWRPVDFMKEGIFVCGLAHSPRMIDESIAMAEAAAARTLEVLSREALPAGHTVAEIRHSLCARCELCISACPYGARRLDGEAERVVVDEISCQGCGSCAAVCPNSASVLLGFRDQQVFSAIEAALD